VGAHVGIGVRIPIGKVSLRADVLGAATLDARVFEVGANAGVEFSF